jgi:hypothetical protein
MAPFTALAALSVVAGAIHFAVVPEHLGEWPAAGVFFVGLGAFQVLWALACLVRPSSRLAWAGVVVNALTVLLWAWSRTLGLPFAPEPGEIEPIGVPDVISSGLEVLLLAGLLARVRRP